MSLEFLVYGLIAGAVGFYLLLALIFPERF